MSQGQPPVADVLQWIKLLQSQEDEAKGGLTEQEAATFHTELNQLAGNLRDDPGRSEELAAGFLPLVERYQPVDHWLQQKDARFKALRTGPGNTEVTFVPPSRPAAETNGTVPVVAEPGYVTQDGRQSEDRTRAATPSTNGAQQPEQNGQGRRRKSDKVANTNTKAPWTPELKLQLFKEIITALLGLVIIGFTLWFALRCFYLAGNTKKIGDAKDLLTILLGIAGVVVGYYFGRVPADARAAQASNRADTAVRQREQVKAQARGISGQLDNILANGAGELTRGGAATASVAGLRSVRDQLHDLGGATE
jgi:hypothetical protein